MKAANWDKLVDELHETTDNMVGVSKAQVIRKWHNWKQYNKQHGKPHPFVVVGDVVVDDIMQVPLFLSNNVDFGQNGGSVLKHDQLSSLSSLQ